MDTTTLIILAGLGLLAYRTWANKKAQAPRQPTTWGPPILPSTPLLSRDITTTRAWGPPTSPAAATTAAPTPAAPPSGKVYNFAHPRGYILREEQWWGPGTPMVSENGTGSDLLAILPSNWRVAKVLGPASDLSLAQRVFAVNFDPGAHAPGAQWVVLVPRP